MTQERTRVLNFLFKEEATCFWYAVALGYGVLHRSRYGEVESWFRTVGYLKGGINVAKAVKILEDFPADLGISMWCHEDGRVVELVPGHGCVVFVSEDDNGALNPHWLPARGLVRDGVRLSLGETAVRPSPTPLVEPLAVIPFSPPLPTESEPISDDHDEGSTIVDGQRPEDPAAPAPESSESGFPSSSSPEGSSLSESSSPSSSTILSGIPLGFGTVPILWGSAPHNSGKVPVQDEVPRVTHVRSVTGTPPFLGPAFQGKAGGRLRDQDTRKDWVFGPVCTLRSCLDEATDRKSVV